MGKEDFKIIGGILFLFAGFAILIQTKDIFRFLGFLPMVIGLYFILSSLK